MAYRISKMPFVIYKALQSLASSGHHIPQAINMYMFPLLLIVIFLDLLLMLYGITFYACSVFQ